MFFFLLQTEQGDIFKVTLESEDDVVSGRFWLFLKKMFLLFL